MVAVCHRAPELGHLCGGSSPRQARRSRGRCRAEVHGHRHRLDRRARGEVVLLGRSPTAHGVAKVGSSRQHWQRGGRHGVRDVHRGVPGAAMTLARSARPETEVVFDPSTYVDGVPFGALARLRRETPVVWVAEAPVLGWPAGPGFWLVLRHADVESVLARPQLFSSSLGATQIRDPATPQALGYVRQMMLNMDPPDHSRLRRLLGRSFTRRAVSQLEDRIRRHARAICDRVFTGSRGECDFAKDVAADMPLLTLADVLGMPRQDRWLLFDWSNRVIGYQA